MQYELHSGTELIPVSYKQPIAQAGNVCLEASGDLSTNYWKCVSNFTSNQQQWFFDRLIMARTAQKKDFGAGSQTDLTR